MSAKERYYDKHIAPKLLALAHECQEHGMSLVVMAEWKPGESGMTATVEHDASFSVHMVRAAIMARGNFDALAIAVARSAHDRGHGSAVLSMMGVPATKAGAS